MINKLPEFELVPQKYDELIKLSKNIAAFKTPEMEKIFAQLMQKYINPMMIYKGD